MQATFLLAGWTKEEPRTHIVRLVDASKVLAAKEALQPLTSYHAYSVQPSKPQVMRLSPPVQAACLAERMLPLCANAQWLLPRNLVVSGKPPLYYNWLSDQPTASIVILLF